MIFAEFAKDFGINKYFRSPKNIKYSLLANFIQLVLEADWVGDIKIEKDFSLNPKINKYFEILNTDTATPRAGDVYIILADKRYRYGIMYDSETVLEQPNHLTPQHVMMKDSITELLAFYKGRGFKVVLMRPYLVRNIFPPSDMVQSINIRDYGAKGDGVTDDSDSIQAAVDAAKSTLLNGGVVYAPPGTYLVTKSINLSNNSTRAITLRGTSRAATKFITYNDITVFLHAEFVTFQDFAVFQLGTMGTGRAFSTPTDRQTAYSVWERLHIKNFKYGIWWRYSLWVTVRNLQIEHCSVGIKMSRNAFPDDRTNPAAPGSWNLNPGYFHNQNTFDNIAVEFGEVGIWGTCNGNTFTNITCQIQESKGASNTVLPVNTPGIGLWLQGGGTGSGGTSTFGSSANIIVNYYAEFTQQPLIIEYARVTLGSMYVQGGDSNANAYPQVIKMIGGYLNARAATVSGADWFARVFNAVDSTIYGDPAAGTTLYGNTLPEGHTLTGTTKWYRTGVDIGENQSFDVAPGAGPLDKVLATMADQTMFIVDIMEIYDGLQMRSASFHVAHWNGDYTRIIDNSGNSPEITLSVSSHTLRVQSTGVESHWMKCSVVAVRKLGQFPYNSDHS